MRIEISTMVRRKRTRMKRWKVPEEVRVFYLLRGLKTNRNQRAQILAAASYPSTMAGHQE